jgi:hypothetical protein
MEWSTPTPALSIPSLALTDPDGYATAFPGCDPMLADVNADGAVNAFDIDPFVLCLTGGGCSPRP